MGKVHVRHGTGLSIEPRNGRVIDWNGERSSSDPDTPGKVSSTDVPLCPESPPSRLVPPGLFRSFPAVHGVVWAQQAPRHGKTRSDPTAPLPSDGDPSLDLRGPFSAG